jgi:hypothetical protein
VQKVCKVAAVGKNGGPFPESRNAGDGHGENDEKIFVGYGCFEGIKRSSPTQKANQRAIFFEEQERNEEAGQRQENYGNADSELKVVGAEFAATAEHARDKEDEKTAEWII